jgi:sugar-specific transcriptional regulator TrmB
MTNLDNNHILDTLAGLGLSSSQSLLYMSGLRLGKTTVINLAKESGLKRPTVYRLLEELIADRLFIKVEQGWKVVYEAAHPKSLYQLLSYKTQLLDTNFASINNLYTAKNTSGFQYYEGLKEIKLLYQQILDEVEFMQDYLVLGNQELFLSLDKPFFDSFIRDRNSKNPKIKMIFTHSEIAIDSAKYQNRSNIQIKFMPTDLSYKQNIIITPTKVIIHNLELPTSAIVLSQENIITSFKSLFYMIWGMMG